MNNGDSEAALEFFRKLRAEHAQLGEAGGTDPEKYDSTVQQIVSDRRQLGDMRDALEFARLLINDELRVSSLITSARFQLRMNLLDAIDIKAASEILAAIQAERATSETTSEPVLDLSSIEDVLRAYKQEPTKTLSALENRTSPLDGR